MSTAFLVGKTITAIFMAEDKKAIMFRCNDGDHIARADGDCCSDTWIESVELPAMGFPARVLDVRHLDMPQEDSGRRYDVTITYGLQIVTDKGYMMIDYRNASNGYYGGNLSWPGEYHYGGVFGQNNSDENWKPLTSDL